MKVENSDTYEVEFLRDIELVVVCNEDENMKEDVEYSKGQTDTVEICELDEKAGTTTLYYASEDPEGLDTFIRNVPLDCFKALKKKVVTWEEE